MCYNLSQNLIFHGKLSERVRRKAIGAKNNSQPVAEHFKRKWILSNGWFLFCQKNTAPNTKTPSERIYMTIKKAVEQTIDSGIKPIILDAQRVKNYQDELEGVRTSLVIKSLALGTLTPNEYRFVARRTVQANGLVERNIEKLFYFYEALKTEYEGAGFFTVSVYARTLLGGELKQMLLAEMEKHPNVDTTKIALEMSADILFENIEVFGKELAEIKELGFKIALCEVGSEFCPILRLNELPYDIVFLDGYVPNSIETNGREQEMQALMTIIATRPVKIYGSCITQEQIPLVQKLGADGYTEAEDEELEEKDWYVGKKTAPKFNSFRN